MNGAPCSLPARPASSASVWPRACQGRLGGQGGRPRSCGDPRGTRDRARSPCRTSQGTPTGRRSSTARPMSCISPASRMRRAISRRRLYPHQAESVGELAAAARGKVERFVLMSSVRAQAGLVGRSRHHRSGPARPHRRLWPLQARSRAASCRERRSLHRAPPSRGLWTRRQRQYREPRHACADADAASLRRARQSPLASRDRQSRLGDRARARLGARPQARRSSSPTPSRSASPTSSPPCAKVLAAALTSSGCRSAR